MPTQTNYWNMLNEKISGKPKQPTEPKPQAAPSDQLVKPHKLSGWEAYDQKKAASKLWKL